MGGGGCGGGGAAAKGGGREVAELEVWMDGRVEGRVLRRSGGGREVAEVEVWMDGRMECLLFSCGVHTGEQLAG